MKRVTLLDVAREAGVSRATASLVVRGSSLVGRETRERVEATMRRLGYVYNLGAARMRSEVSRTIGVIVPNLVNPFFAEMVAGIELVLEEAGMVVVLANSRESPVKQDTFIRRMREHGVDGVILCPAAGSSPVLLGEAREWRLPMVQALRYIGRSEGDYAGTDYAEGMRQATRYLVGLGHQRIAFVSGNRQHSAHTERLEGFQSVMREQGLADDLVVNIPLTHADGREIAAFLLRRSERPTAALCFNDVVALGLMRGLYDLGIEAGKTFSVVGFDDVPGASLSRPLLTTVAIKPSAIGAAAAGLMLERLRQPDRPVESIIEPTRLQIRESAGSPAPLEQFHELTPASRGN